MTNLEKTRRAIIAAAVAGACVAGGAAMTNAATDGSIGATSTGDLIITAEVPGLVRISALSDIDLGTWDGASAMRGSSDACVWSTSTNYNITATGNGTAGAFTITDGTNTIAYTVEWDDAASSLTGTTLTNGNPLAAQVGNNTSSDCNGGTTLNATVIVNIAPAALAGAPAATYNGILNLQVAPE